MKNFCALEGFLENGPQKVQKSCVKGPNSITSYHYSYSFCCNSSVPV